MADIITGTTTGVVDTSTLQGEHADIRREAAEHTNEAIKETLKAGWASVDATKDARYDVTSRIVDEVERNADRLDSRFFDVARDTQDIRAQIVAQQQQIVSGFMGAAKDSEINALKTQVELAKQTTYLSDKIDAGNSKTQDLINELKYHDLNRNLVERNAELVEERHGRRHWRGMADSNQFGAQFAQLQSMMQNFNSQLQDTRQGMVNFGTMAGVGQTSTSNNVR